MMKNTNETFTLNTLIDVGFAKASNVHMENLLETHIMLVYNDAVCNDRDGDGILNEYKQSTELLIQRFRVAQSRKQYRVLPHMKVVTRLLCTAALPLTYTLCDALVKIYIAKLIEASSWSKGNRLRIIFQLKGDFPEEALQI